MVSSIRLPKLLLRLFIAATAALSIQCGGGDLPSPDEPLINLSEAIKDFSAEVGGAAPAAQTISVTNRGDGTLDGLAANVAYTGGQPSGWLTAGLSTTGAPSTLTLSAAPGSLAAGSYTADVAVTSSGASNSPQNVRVTFTVEPAAGGAPVIALSSTNQSFTGAAGGANPAPQALQVTNGGEGTLSGLTAEVTYTAGQPAGWLVGTLSGTTAPSTLNLAATTGSLAAGTYTASVAVSSAPASNSPQAVSVTFTVIQPQADPLIALSSTSRTFSGTAGGANPGSQTVAVSNAGGGTLGGLTAAASYSAGQPTGWLSATLSAASAPSTLTLTTTTGSLTAGTYTAQVAVRSGVATNSPQTVSVTFTVAAAPASPTIVLSAASLTFSGSAPPAQTVSVTNGGGGTLGGLATNIAYTSGSAWLAASLSSTSAPSTLTITATPGSLAEGTYTASVAVSSGVATNSPQTVSVTFTVAAAPASPTIVLSSSSLTFSGSAPPAQTVSVTNGGGGTLGELATNISYASGSGWLAASLSSPAAPSTLTITATPGSLAEGTYTASVAVSSGVASNSPRTASVTLTVGPPPASPSIALSSPSLTFTATQGGESPAAQAVSITNSGGGTLNGLATDVSYTSGSGWLSATLDGNSAPSTLTLTATTASLTAGDYAASVAVSSPDAANSPQVVTVSFTVDAPQEMSETFFASADNLVISNSTDPTTARTVFRSGEIAVGAKYFYIGATFIHLQFASTMKFDVQSHIAGKTILEATLLLYQRNLPADFSGRFALAAIQSSWNTSTITWNDFMSMRHYSISRTNFAATPSTVIPLEFDVRQTVQSWSDGTFVNNGFQIWEPSPVAPGVTSDQATSIQSIEVHGNAAQRPQLFIRWR